VKEDLRQMQEINNKHEEELQNKTNKIHIMRNQINQLQSTITKQENGLSSFQKRINFLTTRKKNNDIITFV
jgi:flagellar biosynthesis chaperone FliJ